MNKPRFALSALLLVVLTVSLATVSRGPAVTWTQPTAPVTQQIVSSNGAAGALTATLTGSSGRMTYIEGFDVTGAGATAASAINVTITGTANTLNFALAVPAGVTADLGTSRLSIRFPTPIPASATNTNIVVNVPSFGSGNTQASVTAYGFTQ